MDLETGLAVSEEHEYQDFLRQVQDALRPHEALRVLADLDINDRDVAIAAGVNEQTPAKWRAGRHPARRQADRIDELRAVVARVLFERGVARPDVANWLRQRKLGLDDRSPLELVGAGEFDDLRLWLQREFEPTLSGRSPSDPKTAARGAASAAQRSA